MVIIIVITAIIIIILITNNYNNNKSEEDLCTTVYCFKRRFRILLAGICEDSSSYICRDVIYPL